MQRASLAAAFAASLLLGSVSAAFAADEARLAEERLLGSADEATQVAAYQPFTREIAAGGVVARSLDAALAQAGVSAATMLEARQAFASVLSLDRDVQPGDRFHVRYEQTFTAEGAPDGHRPRDVGGTPHQGQGHGRHLSFPQPRQDRALLAGQRPGGDAALDAHAARDHLGLVGLRPARRSVRPAAARCGFRQAGANGRPQAQRVVAAAGPADRRGERQQPDDGEYGDAARRVTRARALRKLAGRAARSGGAFDVHARGHRSRGAGRHGGLCRGRRRGGRRSAQRPLRQLDSHRAQQQVGHGLRPSPAFRRASSRARRWCAASS